MRRQKIEIAVFCVATIVFVLQSVGYLAPSWFVQEVTLKHGLDGLSVDGRHLQVPYVKAILMERIKQEQTILNTSPLPDETGKSSLCRDNANIPSSEQGIPNSRKRRKLDKPAGSYPAENENNNLGEESDASGSNSDWFGNKKQLPENPNGDENTAETDSSLGDPAKPVAKPNDNINPSGSNNQVGSQSTQDEENKDKTESAGDSGGGGDDINNNDPKPPGADLIGLPDGEKQHQDKNPVNPMQDGTESNNDNRPVAPDNGNKQDTPDFGFLPGSSDIGETKRNEEDRAEAGSLPDLNNINENFPQQHENNQLLDPVASADDTKESIQTGHLPSSKSKAMEARDMHVIYISAGLWYGRACINSQPLTDNEVKKLGTEWCTLYVRMNESTLDKEDRNINELRIEASIGVVLSLVCLIAASVSCFTQHHLIFRLSVALTSMFCSGAIMAVPVVHVILRHVVSHKRLWRPRIRDQTDINDFTVHDLCDHWSAIVCGAGSLVAVVSALIFTTLLCNSFRKPRKGYDLERPVTIETISKGELPDQCLCNVKATGTMVQDRLELPSKHDKNIKRDGREESNDEISAQTSSARDGGDNDSYISVDGNVKDARYTRDGGNDDNYVIMEASVITQDDDIDIDQNFNASINMEDFEYNDNGLDY